MELSEWKSKEQVHSLATAIARQKDASENDKLSISFLDTFFMLQSQDEYYPTHGRRVLALRTCTLGSRSIVGESRQTFESI